MPIQAPQWLDYLICSVCCHEFNAVNRSPISLGCGHTICKSCIGNLQGIQCPFDQSPITNDTVCRLPINSAILELIGISSSDIKSEDLTSLYELFVRNDDLDIYLKCIEKLVNLAQILRQTRPLTFHHSPKAALAKPIQRKLLMLINCQLLEVEGRVRLIRTTRLLGERVVSELISLHQSSQQLLTNLWTAVRARGCQFLGPAMQEDVLKLILVALDGGTALSRKVLVMFIVQKLEPIFPQASKTSIGHVVQLLYRASCFNLIRRDGESSLMQLKEEYNTYDSLRRVHDMQIIQIASEAGLRIVPEQWSSLLHGDGSRKSEMQSIIDKLQTPQSFTQSIQELIVILQRSGDPVRLSPLRSQFEFLSALDAQQNTSDWNTCLNAIESSELIVKGLVDFMSINRTRKLFDTNHHCTSKYKVSMCRDFMVCGICHRGDNCTFAHSSDEIDMYRKRLNQYQSLNMKNNQYFHKPQLDLRLINSFVPEPLPRQEMCEPLPNVYLTANLNPVIYESGSNSCSMEATSSLQNCPLSNTRLPPSAYVHNNGFNYSHSDALWLSHNTKSSSTASVPIRSSWIPSPKDIPSINYEDDIAKDMKELEMRLNNDIDEHEQSWANQWI